MTIPDAQDEPIQHIIVYLREQLAAGMRRFIRRCASEILRAMADRDVSFPELAARLNVTEAILRRHFNNMADGKDVRVSSLAVIARALGCDITLTLIDDGKDYGRD